MLRYSFGIVVVVLFSLATLNADSAPDDEVQEAINETMAEARRAVDELGVTDAAMKRIQAALGQLAQAPGLKDRPDLSGLHGSTTTKAVVLASEGDDGLTLILVRFTAAAPTPIHDHGTWAVAHEC